MKDADILRKQFAELAERDDMPTLSKIAAAVVMEIDKLPEEDAVELSAYKRLEDECRYMQNENARLCEQIKLMRIQMRGDCGTCKHAGNGGEVCRECLKTANREKWEYEGLPELPGAKMDGGKENA